MASQIQGKDTSIIIYQNGQAIQGLPKTKFRYSAESEIRMRQLLGEARPGHQLLIDGYDATIEFDVDNERLLEITDFLDKEEESGIRTSNWSIMVTESYRDNSRARYSLDEVTFNVPDRTMGGRKEDVAVSWSLKAKRFTLIR